MALAAASVSARTSRGSVAGLVQDPSGAVVAAGGVELRKLETGVVRLILSAQNFSVLAGQALTVDARTEIGDVQESAEGVARQTVQPAIGQTTTQRASAACGRRWIATARPVIGTRR